jgi:hypothetical protein
MTSGVRAQASLTLVDGSDPTHAWRALASGSKSLIFQFAADFDSRQEPVSLGAMVTTSDHKPLVWGDQARRVLINFWDDASRMYVHEKASFMVWYSSVIGHGVITNIVEDLYTARGDDSRRVSPTNVSLPQKKARVPLSRSSVR